MSSTSEPLSAAGRRAPSGAWTVAVPLALLTLLTAAAVRPLGRGPLQLNLGAYDAPYRGGPWGKALRVDLDPPASRDDRLTFYFRPLRDGALLRLPVETRAPLRVTFRARAMVRSSLGAFAAGVPVPEVLVDTGPWDRYTLEVPAAAVRCGGLDLALFLRGPAVVSGARRGRPAVWGAPVGRPEILVDSVELSSDRGIALAWPAASWLALAPLAVALFA